MLRSILLIALLLMLFSFGLTAQVRPDFFPEETTPTNTNFEVYSQKNGVNRRTSLANLRKYFGAQIAVSSAPTPTGNPEAARNKVIVVLPDSATYFVDWNGNSTLLGAGTGAGGGELSNAYISSDTLYLVTPDSTYTLLIPAGADDWGTQVVEKDSTLRGDGTLADPLRVNLDTFPTRQEVEDSLAALAGVVAGLPTGSGTAGKLVKWGTSSSLADSGVEDDGAGLITIVGTRAARLPVGTTAQRSGTPVVGEARVNSTNSNALEWYTGTAWETGVRSAGNGLGTSSFIPYYDLAGRLNVGNTNFRVVNDSTFYFFRARVGLATTNQGFLTVRKNQLANYGAAIVATDADGYNVSSNTFGSPVAGGQFQGANNYTGQPAIIGLATNMTQITIPRHSLFNTYGNIGVLGAALRNQLESNATGGYFYAQTNFNSPTTQAVGSISFADAFTGDLSGGALFGAYNEGRATQSGNTARSVYGSFNKATALSNQTCYGVYASASGGANNWGVYSESGSNYFHSTIQANTLTGTGTQLGAWTAGNIATTAAVGDNMTFTGGTLSVPTRYALVTLDSTQHTLPFISSSTAPDSVGNLQVADIGGIFTISAGKKTVKYSGNSGYFLVNYATSFQGIEGIHLSHLWKNGTLIESSRTRTEVTTTPLSVAGVTVVQLIAGDELQFGYTPDNHVGDNSITTSFLTITITRI